MQIINFIALFISTLVVVTHAQTPGYYHSFGGNPCNAAGGGGNKCNTLVCCAGSGCKASKLIGNIEGCGLPPAPTPPAVSNSNNSSLYL